MRADESHSGKPNAGKRTVGGRPEEELCLHDVRYPHSILPTQPKPKEGALLSMQLGAARLEAR